MVPLGRKSAREKITIFPLDLAGRLAEDDRFELPMQRIDIADYPGLTIEAVSRTLTQTVREGLIGMAACGRSIVVNDHKSRQELKAR